MAIFEFFRHAERSELGNDRATWAVVPRVLSPDYDPAARLIFGVEYFDIVVGGPEHNWVHVYFSDADSNPDRSLPTISLPGGGKPVSDELIQSAIAYLMITQNEGDLRDFLSGFGHS